MLLEKKRIRTLVFLFLLCILLIGSYYFELRGRGRADYFVCYVDVSIVNELGEPDVWSCINGSVAGQYFKKACYYQGSGITPEVYN